MNYYDYLTKKLAAADTTRKTIKTDAQVKPNSVTNIFYNNRPTLKLDGNSIFSSAKKDELAKVDYDKIVNTEEKSAITSESIPEDKKMSPLEFIIKEFLSIDKVKEKADADGNGELTTEEVKNYVEELAKKDGNADDLSLEDFEAVIQELGIDLEELDQTSEQESGEEESVQTEEPVQTDVFAPVDTTPAIQSPVGTTGVSSLGFAGMGAPAASQPKTLDTMTLDELNTEKNTRIAALNEKQSAVNAVLNGQNENVKAAKAEEASAREEYENAIQGDAGAKRFAKDILKNNKEIEKNQKALDENAQKIGDLELKLEEAESSLAGAKGELSALEGALSSLGSKEENKEKVNSVKKQISTKRKEISKQEKAVRELKSDLEKLNKEKAKLENEKTKLEEKKAELDEKVKQFCSEDTKAKLEAYNKAKSRTQEVKSAELSKANGELRTAKSSVAEINAKINEVKAATEAAKYTSSSSLTEPTNNYSYSYWLSQGLDTNKASQLAQTASSISRRDPGQCVGYTRKAINHVYGTNFTNAGPAYNFGNNILSSPELKGKFKKVNGHPRFSELPNGAIVIYSPGSPGYTRGKAAQYGHGGIKVDNAVVANGTITSHLDTYQEAWIPVA